MSKFCFLRMFKFKFPILIICITIFLILTPSIHAQNQLCIPANMGTPVIDGVVFNDLAWNGSAQISLSGVNGVPESAILQVGKNGNNVYISLQVFAPSPTLLSPDTTVVLVFSTDGNPKNDWRIHITPFDNILSSGSNQSPFSVSFWRDSSENTGWNSTSSQENTISAGFWLFDNIKINKDQNHWGLEFKIPMVINSNASWLDGIFFNTVGTFKFYANVLNTSNVIPTCTQDPWPSGNKIESGDIKEKTPLQGKWGTVSFNNRGECGGVSLSADTIGVLDPKNPGIITTIKRYAPNGGFSSVNCDNISDDNGWKNGEKGPENTFVARPHNSMANNAKVSAVFKIANWGLPAEESWNPIGKLAGGLVNPITVRDPNPKTTILPGQYGELLSYWTLSYKQSCLYSKANNQHQCIQVELKPGDVNTRIITASVQQNMDFVPASVFSRDAEISAKGYGNPPGNRLKHEFLITVNTGVQRYISDSGLSYRGKSKDGAAGWLWKPVGDLRAVPSELISLYFSYLTAADKLSPAPKKMSEAITWVARGYLKTGKYLIINGKEYESLNYIGGFGCTAIHNGEVLKWGQKLIGREPDSFKTLVENMMYSLQIKAGEVATVNATIEAVEPRCAISLRGGIGIPHGAFDIIVDPGLSMNAGFEILFGQNWSAEAVVGYHHFADGGLGTNQNVFQFSGNLRFFYPFTRNFRTFINSGAGLYKLDPGDSKLGFNVGAGFDYYMSNQFQLEAAYNYHTVNTTDANINFSTLQGGFRYRF